MNDTIVHVHRWTVHRVEQIDVQIDQGKDKAQTQCSSKDHRSGHTLSQRTRRENEEILSAIHRHQHDERDSTESKPMSMLCSTKSQAR